jgi:arylsulfatase A-like enzyme
MNILYLHCHDAGRYIEPCHPELTTPHLQDLAETGMLFRQAHCANPTCSPSRASLLTGRCAHANGMLGLAHRGWRLDDYSATLPAFLGQHGYRTILCGQQHIAIPPYAEVSEIGYDEIVTQQTGFDEAASGAESFLILRGPGGFEGGKVSDALVSHLDLFPTLCEMLAIEAPNGLEGRSLAHLAENTLEHHRDTLFGEVNYHAAAEPMRSVRTRRWKYIRHYTGDRLPRLPNIDNGISKYFLCSNGFCRKKVPSEELYDLVEDPQESHNLAEDPNYAGALMSLREQLDRWMEETEDPLLHGTLPHPEHIIVTPPENYSAGTGNDRAPDSLPWSEAARQFVETSEKPGTANDP